MLEAERLGFYSVWTAEAYGSDAVSTAAWVLSRTTKIHVGTGIMQMPARTPACAAGTAITLSQLSGGRFILGLGPSGPQVVEGWHGVAYGKPLTRTREYIEIIRKIVAREEPAEYDGEIYQLPYRGPDATGLGKPLKSIVHADPGLRIFTASISLPGLRCAAEVADGVIPVWMNPERFDLFEKPLREGFHTAGGGKGLDRFEIAPFTSVVLGDDLEKCRLPVKGMLALYVGGMGARDKNFYNDYAKRLGYEEAAARHPGPATWRARSSRRWRRSRTHWWTRWRWSARRTGSARGSAPGGRRDAEATWAASWPPAPPPRRCGCSPKSSSSGSSPGGI